MEELGLNPASEFDCELYDAYHAQCAEHEADREMTHEHAGEREADGEASYLEQMADLEAVLDDPAAIDEVEERVARFRVERGLTLPVRREWRPPFRGMPVRHGRQGRAPRSRRVRSRVAASRDGPARQTEPGDEPGSDDPPDVADPPRREVAP
jgi:hypothetical protein